MEEPIFICIMNNFLAMRVFSSILVVLTGFDANNLVLGSMSMYQSLSVSKSLETYLMNHDDFILRLFLAFSQIWPAAAMPDFWDIQEVLKFTRHG